MSKSIIFYAQKKFSNLSVVSVTAYMNTLTERVSRRGRESIENIEQRLNRVGTNFYGSRVYIFSNDSSLPKTSRKFTNLLEPISRSVDPYYYGFKNLEIKV